MLISSVILDTDTLKLCCYQLHLSWNPNCPCLSMSDLLSTSLFSLSWKAIPISNRMIILSCTSFSQQVCMRSINCLLLSSLHNNFFHSCGLFCVRTLCFMLWTLCHVLWPVYQTHLYVSTQVIWLNLPGKRLYWQEHLHHCLSYCKLFANLTKNVRHFL
jgi:hypothetical protein